MKDYDHMQKVLQNNVKLNKETIGEKAIDFAIKVLKEESRSFRGDYATESWLFNDFHPDIESLHIKWKNQPLNVETKIDTHKHQDEKDKPKTIPQLLMDLKFLDDKSLYVRAHAIYDAFKEAKLDHTISESLTRSFMKYFYENDSWRVRMNDVWAEWEYHLIGDEDDIEKVKVALQIICLNWDLR